MRLQMVSAAFICVHVTVYAAQKHNTMQVYIDRNGALALTETGRLKKVDTVSSGDWCWH